jgi:phenylalanyl-tRNA synthetase alpha subunit
MPTGFGKTYNVFKFIYDNYKEFAAKNRKILFLTNLKKNLALKDLKNHFIENGNEDDYNKYVLFIDSNSETVIKNFIDIDDEIPDEFKNTEKYKKLKKCIEIYQTKQLPKEVKDNLETQIRKELEPIFRTDIQAKLKEEVIDISQPSVNAYQGSVNPFYLIEQTMTDIFIGMGYQVAEGPEVESNHYNFELLK